jgi:RNA polymerase sigma factor (sigma-70 family)
LPHQGDSVVVQAEGDPRGDAELIAELGAGDLAVLRELYDRHAPWLAVRLARRCNDPEVVADALQDTFTAVWKSAEGFDGRGDVAAWIWGIAIRRLVSRLRGRKDVLLLDPAAPSPGHGPATPSVEEQVLLDVHYGDLGAALGRLSPEMRAVVQATVLDGLSTKEAAQLLDLPQNTVKTRLHRAKAHLRDDLAGERA